MFFDKKSDNKVHKGSVFAGYDLGNDFSQISCCIYEEDDKENVESVATVAGTKQYNIPTVLFKKRGVNQWLYGREAVKADREEGTRVENLPELAIKGEMIEIEDESYDPVALLTLFIKRSLALMSLTAASDSIGAFMFTVDELDDRMVGVLSQAAANLNLKTPHIYFQSHTESFYYFMLHQPEELWNYQVLACEHNGVRLKTYRMERNKRTTPIVVFIDEEVYGALALPDEREAETNEAAYADADEKFYNILKKQCADRIISSAYLLGDGFKTEWAKESLRFLCRSRRVFQGNNLFCKGACFALLERFRPGKAGKEHIFLGPDKLKSNVGMNVLRRGKESYYALLDAGENWYEIYKNCEILLPGDENVLSFLITPLNGERAQIQEIVLEDAPVREGAFSRFDMEIKMISAKCVEMKITDLGFGELFPVGGRMWKKQFEVT